MGDRELIWAGLRADDIAAISDLPHLSGSFSIIGGHDRGVALDGIDYEDLTGTRVDLDAWDIEDQPDAPATHRFREAMLTRLGEPTALLPYRPSRFLSSISFARRDACTDLGMFGGLQSAFEHKPWIESAVRFELGLPGIPWRYVADENRDSVLRMLESGPVMLRRSRSSGGVGLHKLSEPEELLDLWPSNAERFVAVAPYLQPTLPINVSATVWPDTVTIGYPSVQLIGIRGLTDRPFGYCGNDFGATSALDAATAEALEQSILAIGQWLRAHGYRGTVGMDFLIHDGVPLFTEVNPRFQGSTHLSSEISSEAGEACVYLDHMAAMLGLPASRHRPLLDMLRGTPSVSHFIIHQSPEDGSAESLSFDLRGRTEVTRVDVTAKPGLTIEPGGVIARVTTNESITATGFELVDHWEHALSRWRVLQGAGEEG